MLDAMGNLGPRLKEIRLKQDTSLREIARQLNVSPSFLSQIENGKSQPSVATLYAIAKLLGVSVDLLFKATGDESDSKDFIQRTDLDHPADAWHESGARISLVNPQSRSTLSMDQGVAWERLSATPENDINFMEIIYQPGAGSNSNGDLIVHEGYEYGYALEGEIEVTIGEAIFLLTKSHSIGFDSTIPHRLRNISTQPFRGIWFVHGCQVDSSPDKGSKSK